MTSKNEQTTRTSEDESWLRRHALLVGAAIYGVIAMSAFTWAEWGYFKDSAKSHHEPMPHFWDSEHVHDWLYNAASNWQSELLFGIVLLVILMKLEGPSGADKGDT